MPMGHTVACPYGVTTMFLNSIPRTFGEVSLAKVMTWRDLGSQTLPTKS